MLAGGFVPHASALAMVALAEEGRLCGAQRAWMG